VTHRHPSPAIPENDLTILRGMSAFSLPGFRTQWLASLCVSLAFEMELIVYLWYVFSETGSAFYLSLLAALPFMGTLFAPLAGHMGDSLGHKRTLLLIRAMCFALSGVLTLCLIAGLLTPTLVLAVFGLAGLLRPIDMPLRAALLAEITPPEKMLSASSLSRITIDLARLCGALAGGGIVIWFGMAWAASMASTIYGAAVVLTLLVPSAQILHLRTRKAGFDPLGPFREVLVATRFVMGTPTQTSAMALAFLINLLIYPFIIGLVPYIVAVNYQGGQAELSYMTAALAAGCILASLSLSAFDGRLSLGRAMCIGAILWSLATLLILASRSASAGIAVYALLGFLNGLCVMPMAALQMLNAPRDMRGRIMGLRAFAVYGTVIGLLAASFSFERLGLASTLVIFCTLSALGSLAILRRWNRYY
jgi:MFS family permease